MKQPKIECDKCKCKLKKIWGGYITHCRSSDNCIVVHNYACPCDTITIVYTINIDGNINIIYSDNLEDYKY